VIFAGRGLTTTAQRGAGQELPTDRVFEPVTKWAIRIDRAELVPEVLHQAVAKDRVGLGRHGPDPRGVALLQ
jgi:acetolactate synthase-1/2/3 large subunit